MLWPGGFFFGAVCWVFIRGFGHGLWTWLRWAMQGGRLGCGAGEGPGQVAAAAGWGWGWNRGSVDRLHDSQEEGDSCPLILIRFTYAAV